MRRRSVFAATLCLLSVAACSDTLAPARTARTALSPANDADLDQSEGRGVFQRYVAIGTSLSMGWQSDGVIAATQKTSWPEQLAEMAHRTITEPYIDGTGCRSPLASPLASGVRLSGEPAGQNPATLSCSPLRDDVVKPVQNLAINAAKTHDALFTTPENSTDLANNRLIARVLQPGMTQVSSMMAQNPKLVSVELGGNDVLDARSGIVIPGPKGTVTRFEDWALDYDAILDSVQKVAKEAVIVGLTDDVGSFPAFRRGSEMWAARFVFAAMGVTVESNCEGSENLLFVPVLVPTAVGRAAATGSASLQCAGGGPTTQDFILTPTEAAAVNALLAQMNAHIQQQAADRQFAYFALQELYGRADIKGPFNPVTLMFSAEPYGPFISLDGVHPTAAGAKVLADAAARALDARYNHSILADAASLIANQ